MSHSAKEKTLSRNEAASLAKIGVRKVDKAIEEDVVSVKRRDHKVWLDSSGVVTLVVLDKVGKDLRLERAGKKQIQKWVESGLPQLSDGSAELQLSDTVVVRIDAATREVARQTEHYLANRDRYIEINPEIRSGDPVISGTRLSVRSVAARLKSGDQFDDLIADYPEIDLEAFQTSLIWADAHPSRGRPKRPWADAPRK